MSLRPDASSERRRLLAERGFHALCASALALPLLLLLYFAGSTALEALPRLSFGFLTSFPSRFPERAGILAALAGSAWLLLLTMAFAVPIGVGAALWLEEYARPGRLLRLLELNIENLAGMPSILYGLLGLEIFVRVLGLGRSLLAGAATLSLLLLPMVIMTSREALRSVPQGMREACFALGAGRFRTLWHVVLPMALPGILTGVILALARALGEAAPLVVLGALTYVAFVPESVHDAFTALPIQIFNWLGRPQAAFRENAAAAIVVLLVLILALNGTAIVLRARFERRRSQP